MKWKELAEIIDKMDEKEKNCNVVMYDEKEDSFRFMNSKEDMMKKIFEPTVYYNKINCLFYSDDSNF